MTPRRFLPVAQGCFLGVSQAVKNLRNGGTLLLWDVTEPKLAATDKQRKRDECISGLRQGRAPSGRRVN